MSNRDFSRDVNLSKKDMLTLINYFFGGGLNDKEIQIETCDEDFNKIKHVQLENTTEYKEYLKELSPEEANKYFIKFMTRYNELINEIIEFSIDEMNNLKANKNAFIEYITENNKDFNKSLIKWIKNQRIEIIYQIYNKTVIKENLFKSLIPFQNSTTISHQKTKYSNDFENYFAKLKLDEKIKYILRTNLPYKKLSKDQKEKWDTLKKLEENDPSKKYLYDFAMVIYKKNQKEMKQYSFDNANNDKNIVNKKPSQDITYEIQDISFELVNNLTNDIIKAAELNKYLTQGQIKLLIEETSYLSIDNIIKNLNNKILLNNNQQTNNFNFYFDSFGIKDEKIIEFTSKHKKEYIWKINIVFESLYRVVSEYMIERIIDHLPKKIKNSHVFDYEYKECLFTTKLQKIRFQIVHLKFLFDNAKTINSRILHSIFDMYSLDEICSSIYNLKLLKDNKMQLHNIKDDKLNDFYIDFCKAFFMTNEQKEYLAKKLISKINYRQVYSEPFEKLNKFIKRLK